MNASARENILLGQDFDKGWYDQVVFNCGLDKDFQQFIYGDATIIGDRGVQISGGQRARISLARALYRDADLLILDDPLSAVDSKTGRLIYNHAIKGLVISRGKTVVLATHQHQFITDEKCVAMDHGKILLVGSYASCRERLQGIQGQNVLFAQSDETTSGDIDDQAHGNVKEDIEEDKNKTMPGFNHSIIGAGDSLISREVEDDKAGSPDDDHKESREKGGVTLSTWRHYERALGGRFVSIIIVCMMLLTQASLILAVAMTASWAQRSQTQVGLLFARVEDHLAIFFRLYRLHSAFC
jgi:ATP-binding cassette subfamily C (CFTR/MRP) protein 4